MTCIHFSSDIFCHQFLVVLSCCSEKLELSLFCFNKIRLLQPKLTL